jgi:hypothetical protein
MDLVKVLALDAKLIDQAAGVLLVPEHPGSSFVAGIPDR